MTTAVGTGAAALFVVDPVVDQLDVVRPEPGTVVGVGLEPVGFAGRRVGAVGPADTE